MTGFLRLLLILLLSVFLAGCSRVKFAYHQLDWLIPLYIDDYIELSESQDSYLETEVNNLLRWHCTSQLKPYAALLRSSNKDFQQGTMDAEKLGSTLNQIEDYWKEIKRQASPAIARLLLTSEPAQLDEFFNLLQEKNHEWLAEFQSQTSQELREHYQARMTDELERWFGPLTTAQQQEVTDWSQRFEPLGLQGLQARQLWQARLRTLLGQRAAEEAFLHAIEELFVNPYAGQPADYLSRLEHNRLTTIELLARLGGQLNGQQREHLDHMVRSIAEDFDQLACLAEGLKSQPAEISDPTDRLLGPF